MDTKKSYQVRADAEKTKARKGDLRFRRNVPQEHTHTHTHTLSPALQCPSPKYHGAISGTLPVGVGGSCG